MMLQGRGAGWDSGRIGRLPFGLQVDLSTHAIGGLSKNDFVVAAKIDAVPTEYSPKWLREHKEKQAAS